MANQQQNNQQQRQQQPNQPQEQQDQQQQQQQEQQKLRREYIAAVKMNLRTQLDNIDMQEKDGTIVNLGERYGSKRKH